MEISISESAPREFNLWLLGWPRDRNDSRYKKKNLKSTIVKIIFTKGVKVRILFNVQNEKLLYAE